LTCIYELGNVTQTYGDRTVLDIRDMKIDKGSILGISGPNGSGKSTLLRILAFLEKPKTGKIFFKGKAVHDIGEDLRREATLLLQESSLLKRSVFDNVAYGLKVRGLFAGIRENVNQALSMVGLEPGQFARRSWFELSGGEAQRVALASRLVLKPDVLLLDEPTASIDIQSARIITKTILDARRDFGTTVIIVSHDLEWASSASDDVISMHSGRIHSRGPENIIPGPWERCGDKILCHSLDDGQIVTATDPGAATDTALLDPRDIVLSIGIPENISARNTITGTVMRMNLENGQGGVLVTVMAGGLTFTSSVTRESVTKLELMPGSSVTLLFKATAIRWV